MLRAPPQTPLGSSQRSSDPLAGFKVAALRQGGEGKGMGKGRGERWEEEGGGKEEKGKGWRTEGKGERGNGRNGTGHEMGRGGKGRRGATPQTSIPGAAVAEVCKLYVQTREKHD